MADHLTHLKEVAPDQKQELAALGETYLVPDQNPGIVAKIMSFIWDADTHLKSKEERRFLFKLDCAVMTTLCLGWFCKYLDQSNLSNAYVSGMEEDLGFTGNQYTYLTTIYTITYAIMQIPSTIIISKVRPSYWLFMCEIGWGAFTFAQAGAKSVNMMYGFRTLIGLFESSFFPCGLMLLGSWYSPTELAKRTAIFHMASAIGSSFGGDLMLGVISLDGKAGLAGWRWLFIVSGCITVPCALMCLFILPDYPHNTRAWYFNETDIAIANARAAKFKKAPVRGQFSLATWKRVLFNRPEYYLFAFAYIFFGQACQPASYYSIWLKDKKFTVAQRNLYPTFTSYIEIVMTPFWGFMSDYFGSRWAFIMIPLTIANFPLGVLAIGSDSAPQKLVQAAFNLCGTYLITSIMYSWANETFASDPEARALTIGSMNGFQYATNAWLTLVVWKQTQGPRWAAGFGSAWAFIIIAMILCTIIWYRQKLAAKNTAEDASYEEPSQSGSAVVDYDEKTADLGTTVGVHEVTK